MRSKETPWEAIDGRCPAEVYFALKSYVSYGRLRMIEIRQTAIFTTWIKGLADRRAKLAFAKRIDRLAYGHMGDVKPGW